MSQPVDLYEDTTKFEYRVTYIDKDPKTLIKRHYTSRWGDIYQLQQWLPNVIPTRIDKRFTNDTDQIQPD